MECPDCKGVGTLPRAEIATLIPNTGAHYTSFPKLCDRCSGSGDVSAAKPASEGQAVVAVP
jgi:DnaJ-class molecular chaperone